MSATNEKSIVAIGEMLGKLTFNPFYWYKQMRNESPVCYDPDMKVWCIFLYDDVKRVLEDKEHFSSHFPVEPGSSEELLSKTMYNMDPPRHTQMRSVVNRAFTPKVIKQWDQRISKIADELLDNIDGKEEFDLVNVFSRPLPIIVISELLGVSAEHLDRFREWSDSFTSAPGDSSHETVIRWQEDKIRKEKELAEFFAKVIEEKRLAPGNDVISILIRAEEEGVKLTGEELVPFCVHLLAAGNESTASLITSMVYNILEEPGLYARLRNNPALVPLVTEETLRYRSSFQMTRRLATRDVELNGHIINKGQVVLAMIGSANRDESKFSNADTFDIHRDPNPHLALGQGIHFCLGAPLVHLEANNALTALLRRYSAIEHQEPFTLYPSENSAVYGLRSLPLRVKS